MEYDLLSIRMIIVDLAVVIGVVFSFLNLRFYFTFVYPHTRRIRELEAYLRFSFSKYTIKQIQDMLKDIWKETEELISLCDTELLQQSSKNTLSYNLKQYRNELSWILMIDVSEKPNVKKRKEEELFIDSVRKLPCLKTGWVNKKGVAAVYWIAIVAISSVILDYYLELEYPWLIKYKFW